LFVENREKAVWLGIAFDVLVIVSFGVWLIGLAADGAITIAHAAYALFGLVALRAIGRASGMRLMRLTFSVGLPLAALAAFVVWRGGGDFRLIGQLLPGLLALFLALLAIYILVYGMFRRGRRKD